MTALFSDSSKFKKLDKDPSLTQLASLQNYLREIHKRNEIDDSTYTYVLKRMRHKLDVKSIAWCPSSTLHGPII